MKRKVFNRIVCLMTTITMLATPFSSLADDLPAQDDGIEMTVDDDQGAGDEDIKAETEEDAVIKTDIYEEDLFADEESENEEEASPVLNLEDDSLDAGEFISDDNAIKIEGDVEPQEGEEVFGEPSITFQDVELQAGEEVFPENSESETIIPKDASLDAYLPDISEFEGCEKISMGEISPKSSNASYLMANNNLGASATSMALTPANIRVIRGNTETIFIDVNNLNTNAILEKCAMGDEIISVTGGTVDYSNGIRIPIYIKGEKNGVADMAFVLKNAQTYDIICYSVLHITVYDGPQLHLSTKEVNIKQGETYNLKCTVSGIMENVTLYLGLNNENAIQCSWGGLYNDNTALLRISGKASGSGTVTIYLKRDSDGVTLASASVQVNIKGNAKVTASMQEIGLMAGTTAGIDITVTNCNDYAYLICSWAETGAYELEWGDWKGNAAGLNIKGNYAGGGTINVFLKAYGTDEILAQTSFKVNVYQPMIMFTSNDVSLKVGDERTVGLIISGICGEVTLNGQLSNEAICTGRFDGGGRSVSLIIKGQNAGTTNINLWLTDPSGKTLCSETIKVTVENKGNPQVVVGKSNVEVSVGNSVVVPVSCKDVCEDVAFFCETDDSKCFSFKWADSWSGGAVNLTITGEAEGTGTARLRMYNRKNETLAFATINVAVKNKDVNVSDISYAFRNFSEIASEKACQYMFDGASWKAVYKAGMGSDGNCFGMSATAGLFYVPANGVNVSSYASSKNKIGQLSENDRSSDTGLTVKEFIQAMLITQAAADYYEYSVGNLDALIKYINSEVKEGRVVELGIYGKEGAHSILALGTQRLNNATTRVLVYDNNYPNTTRYLTITRDGNGKANSWSYDINDKITWGTGRPYAKLTYTQYSNHLELWNNRGKLSTSRKNMFAVNSKDFTLYDVYDYPVAVMKNGEFISEEEDIYCVHFKGLTLDENQSDSGYSLIYMPVELYTIKNTDKSIDELDLTFTNLEYGVEVTTTADEVMLCADDTCDLAAAMINGCDQKDYSITLLKSDDKGELQTIEISGVGQADVVSAALDSGSLDTSNIDGSTIVISDGADFEKHVSDITLDKYYKEIIEGDKFTISATVTPSDAVDAKVSWSSTNEAVATVDDNGCVEAVAEGYATIVAKAGGITTSCSVNVITKGSRPLPADKVHVTSISFNETNVSLKPGQSKQLEVTITPEDATNKKLSWASDNESAVTVSDNGVITAVSEGQATITVTSVDNGNAKASCIVTVSSAISGGSATDPQPCIDETTTELTLVKGQKFVLTEKDWKSSDNKVVNVNKGKVTVKKDGKAELSRDGQTINVTVLAPSFDAKSVKMISGQEKSIVLNNTGDLEVLYLSNAPDVAAVSEDGEITALSKGSAVINAYVNGVVYKYTVKVADVDTSKRDFSKTVELVPMQTVSIKIQGFNAKKAVWSSASQVSENEIPKGYVFADSVVKISRSGKLTAIGSGETTLTATGGSDTPVTISIVVSEPVEKTLHLNLKSSKTLKMYGVKGYLDWNIEDNTIVEVSKNKVTPKAAGSTELTAQYEGFSYKVTVYVEDIALATDDKLTGKSNKYSVSMKTGDTIELLPVKLYQPMIFKSNKSEVAYADEDGLLTARSAGTARLTAKVNGKTVTVTVKVTD